MASISSRTWSVAGASVAGRNHTRHGLECQDVHSIEFIGDDIVLLVVADGAGSSSMGAKGAAVAVSTCSDALVGSLDQTLFSESGKWRAVFRDAVEVARDAVVNEAIGQQVDLHSMACTLLVLVAGSSFVAAAQIGDGATIALDASGEFVCPTFPNFGEYYNEATFITSQDVFDRVEYSIIRDKVIAVGAITDGLQLLALMLKEKKPYPDFFYPCIEVLQEVHSRTKTEKALRRLLQSDRVTARTGDDLTLVLAVRQPATEVEYVMAD